jgi:diguanylate cyclase (GGDEF)-like protein
MVSSSTPARLTASEGELRFFVETAHALASNREPKTVLRLILDHVKTMIRCEAWSLFVIDSITQDLVFDIVGGPKARRLKGLRIKPGQGIVGWAAEHGKSVMVADARKDPRFLEDIDRATGFRTRTILCVPIFRKKKPVAVLEMINKIGAPFARRDLKLLSRLATQVAVALERTHLHDQISSLGITDELTNMYNARYLDQTLEREVRRCKRYGSMMALIFLDLDNFKGINDTHGHPLGSRCLAEVSQIMVKSVRDVDILARYGGDEFVVILPETTVATAWMVAERLHESIGSHIFLADEGIKARLTASIGIAGFPDHAQTKADLIRKADEAMYRAKSAGRNRICLADQP